jgi:hypothetical protein
MSPFLNVALAIQSLLGQVTFTNTPVQQVCDVSLFPSEIRRELSFRVEHAIGGGQVKSGDFTFCTFLYSDPSLKPTNSVPSQISSVPGVGWSAMWVNQGKAIDETVTESYGILPDQLTPKARYDGVAYGQAGGRIGGGIPFSTNGRSDQVTELAIELQFPHSRPLGGKLSFRQSLHGIEDIAASPWPSSRQE